MNNIPKLKKYSCGKIYRYLSTLDKQEDFSNTRSVEFYEEIPRDNIQGCLEAWLEALKKGYYRINLI